jgi:hypothetical protein
VVLLFTYTRKNKTVPPQVILVGVGVVHVLHHVQLVKHVSNQHVRPYQLIVMPVVLVPHVHLINTVTTAPAQAKPRVLRPMDVHQANIVPAAIASQSHRHQHHVAE